MARAKIGKPSGLVIPCAHCTRNLLVRMFLARAGGDLVNRKCNMCSHAEVVVAEAISWRDVELSKPKAPRTCWACHDQPTPTRRSKVCRNCAAERKRLQTEFSRAQDWILQSKGAVLESVGELWDPPKAYLAMVTILLVDDVAKEFSSSALAVVERIEGGDAEAFSEMSGLAQSVCDKVLAIADR